MIRHPKTIENYNLTLLLQKIMEENFEKLPEYLKYNKTTDDKGRYLPYNKFRFRVNKGLDPELAWFLVRSVRNNQSRKLINIPGTSELKYCLTSTIEKAISNIDRHTTTSSLEVMLNNIGERKHAEFLFKQLTEEEAISSSQLEGAATTTLKAKQIIREKRKPRTIDEKMIIGNFKMMKFAWDHKDEKISNELIKEFHEIGVEGILDEKYLPGNFRQNNDVIVQDRDGDVLHYPPNFEYLEDRIEIICDWINENQNEENEYFLHPLVKAITLHFLIGHEHPFQDGNGRVARALFYWFMFKKGYASFKYIAISTLLKKAPSKYADSYVYTENDSMDMTYFIEHQCNVIVEALENFRSIYFSSLEAEKEFSRLFYTSEVFKKLSPNEKTVFAVAQAGDFDDFTAKDVEGNLGVANNTALKILSNLEKYGLFKKKKVGRTSIFNIVDKDKLVGDWKQKR